MLLEGPFDEDDNEDDNNDVTEVMELHSMHSQGGLDHMPCELKTRWGTIR